jgi:hypothetical protein
MHWSKKTATSITIRDSNGNIILKDIRENYLLEEPRVAATSQGCGIIASCVGSGSEISIRLVPLGVTLMAREAAHGT